MWFVVCSSIKWTRFSKKLPLNTIISCICPMHGKERCDFSTLSCIQCVKCIPHPSPWSWEAEKRVLDSVEMILLRCTVESRFFEPARETEDWFEKSEIKLLCSTEERETTFGSSYREVRKNEGSRNRDCTVCIFTAENYKKNGLTFVQYQHFFARFSIRIVFITFTDVFSLPRSRTLPDQKMSKNKRYQ